MTKRILCIFDRKADADEKLKSLFIWIVFGFAFGGAFGLYAWGHYWLNGEPLILLSRSQLYAVNVATVIAFIIVAYTAVSLRAVRLSYRESTYLKEVDRGYHEPIVNQYEPIRDMIQDEVRDVKVRIERGGQTTYLNLAMTADQAKEYFDQLHLNANELRHLIEDHKGWEPVTRYLENRKIRVNSAAFAEIPGTIPRGEGVYLPV